jgi:transcriptional regulator with XRE-family HTH domain
MKDINIKPKFSQNLIRLRKERGLTQAQLAELTGITRRMIGYYETEAIKPPLDKVEIIAKKLNVGINELIGTNEPTKIQSEFAQLDGRTLKKLKSILLLSPEDRHLVYSYIDSLLNKRKQKQDFNK